MWFECVARGGVVHVVVGLSICDVRGGASGDVGFVGVVLYMWCVKCGVDSWGCVPMTVAVVSG